MSITSDVEMLITEYTRQGMRPRYIVIGYSQFRRWNEELKSGELRAPAVEKSYLGCDIVICSSDIIEVVGEAADQFRFMSSKRVRP
jgi:hypothetical protein